MTTNGLCVTHARADFIRIGPVRRMDRALLPFSLHSTARGRSETAAELEEMLKAAGSLAEAAVIRVELAQACPLPLQAQSCMCALSEPRINLTKAAPSDALRPWFCIHPSLRGGRSL